MPHTLLFKPHNGRWNRTSEGDAICPEGPEPDWNPGLVALAGTERKTPLQTEISFINVSVPYKRITSQFSDLFLCLLFFKNNQLKVILMSKKQILKCLVQLPFIVNLSFALCELSVQIVIAGKADTLEKPEISMRK